MSSTVKSLVFWLVIVVAAVAVYQISNREAARADAASVTGEWLMAGDSKQPCAVFRQGDVLLVVNERGDQATGRMTGEKTLTIIKGDHWEPGVTAELHDEGRSLVWSDGSVWKRR